MDNVDQDVRMLLHSLEELILQRPQRLCLKTRRCRSLAHAIAYMHETALQGYYSTRCMRARKRDRRGHSHAEPFACRGTEPHIALFHGSPAECLPR